MIGLDAVTLHSHPQSLCSANPGVYIVEPSGKSGGVFLNSDCSVGAWGGWSKSLGVLTITAGLVSGYRSEPVLPFVAPSIKLGHYRFSYLPRSPGSQSSGLHLSVEFNLPASAGF